MGFTSDLMDGLATLVAAPNGWTYSPAGIYTANQVGVAHSNVPATPDRVVVLTPYWTGDDPVLSDSELDVQVRTRGTRDPRVCEDLDDDAFDVLQNLPRTQVGPITVTSAYRTSGAYLGVDGNGRHERTSNYRLLVHRPSTHRI